jgi:hypothetical protein
MQNRLVMSDSVAELSSAIQLSMNSFPQQWLWRTPDDPTQVIAPPAVHRL